MTTNEAVKPDSVGYHCSGECWRSHGSSAELIKWLANISPAVRDWFAYGEWATEEKLGSHALPPMEDIHPTQDFLVMHTVERYMNGAVADDDKKFYETHPTLFKWHGNYYVFQGTHRLTALYLNQATEFTGWILDLDSLAN